jgi:hypothetical protein
MKSFVELLLLLPVQYKEDELNRRMIQSIEGFFDKDLSLALSALEDFSDLLDPEGFALMYSEHQRLLNLTLGRVMGYSEHDDQIFENIAESVFEAKTNKRAKDHQGVFKLVLLLIRGKHNIEQNRKYKEQLAEESLKRRRAAREKSFHRGHKKGGTLY